MKIRNIAVYTYFISCIIAIVGLISNSELLLLVTKPIIIPSIYFYYISKVRNISLIFTLVLICNFIGDAIVILRLDNPLYMMTPYLISYLLLLVFVFQDAAKMKLTAAVVSYSALILSALIYILILLVDIDDADGRKLVPALLVYGLVLTTLFTVAAYNYLSDKSLHTFYMLVAVGCSWFSDVFYVLYNLHFHIPVMNYINAAMQLFSYFFFVKYIVARNKANVVRKIAVKQ